MVFMLPGKNPEDRDRRTVLSLDGKAVSMTSRETMDGRNPSSRAERFRLQ